MWRFQPEGVCHVPSLPLQVEMRHFLGLRASNGMTKLLKAPDALAFKLVKAQRRHTEMEEERIPLTEFTKCGCYSGPKEKFEPLSWSINCQS